MRPVNLIPPEERRGDRAPTRTGPIAYLIVGALALALGAVTMIVLTSNQIADREDEIAALEVREAAAREKAEALAPYAEFASLEETRATTVDSLARSRFDWERVLRELALVIPPGVQLTNVTGTVAPGIQLEGASGGSLREGAAGPALEILGCAADTRTVAEFAAALEDIDGVTRVGVNRSASTGDTESEGVSSGSATGGCETDKQVYQFELLAAFDEVVVAPAAGAASGAPSTETATATDPAVADAQAQEQEARDSTEEQTDEAKDAAGLVPGVAR